MSTARLDLVLQHQLTTASNVQLRSKIYSKIQSEMKASYAKWLHDITKHYGKLYNAIPVNRKD